MPLLEVKRYTRSGQVDALAKHGYPHIKLLGTNLLNQFAVEAIDVAQALLDVEFDEAAGPLLHSDGSTVRLATAAEVETIFPNARDADDLALAKMALKSFSGKDCRARSATLETIRLAVNRSLPNEHTIDTPTMKSIWESAVEDLT